MDAHEEQETTSTGAKRGVTWLLGLLGAVAIGGVAAASGSTPPPEEPPVERAELVAEVEPPDIRSGDDHLDDAHPPTVSPPIRLEAGRNQLTEDSPWSGLWGPEIEPLAAYEPQRACLPGARPAVAAFAELLEQAYPQGRDLGIARACEAGARSEHKEGRAYDWGVRVTSPAERMAAEELVAWLLATDEHGNEHAMARRLGVMYVIWDGHIWSAAAADDGWRVYRGASPHTDHVHLSFSWAGAVGTTSFWDAARLGPWLFGHVAVDRLPSSFDLGRDRYRAELGDAPGTLRAWGVPPERVGGSDTGPVAAEAGASGDPVSPAPAPAPAPTTTVPPPPAPLPSAPTGVVGPVLDAPLPAPAPVAPTVVVTTTIPVIEEVGDAVGEVVEDLEGTGGVLGG